MSRSKRALVLIALGSTAACNAVFGIDTTKPLPPIDAAFFDAPIDAPFACPAIGTTPHFSTLLHQPLIQQCTSYTADVTGHAVAECYGIGLSEGPLDGQMTAATGDLADLSTPRVSPEGDELFTIKILGRGTPAEIHVLGRSGASWTFEHLLTVPFGLADFPRIGTPTTGPVRRLAIINQDVLYEVSVASDGTATAVDQYTAADLGMDTFSNVPNLSPDGLRLTLTGQVGGRGQMVFTDRASLAARFRAADPIDAFANVDETFMTADCARIYFPAVASIMFVQRHDGP